MLRNTDVPAVATDNPYPFIVERVPHGTLGNTTMSVAAPTGTLAKILDARFALLPLWMIDKPDSWEPDAESEE
jgi:hypothetical protein